MRDAGEFNIEYSLRKLFFENSEKSGNKTPTFADCNFDLYKNHTLRVGIKSYVFSDWQYLEIDLKPFNNGNLQEDLKKSYRCESNKGLYWFESMKD